LPEADAGVQRSYLLLEYLGKETPSDRIERGPLPPDDAVAIVDALASALAAVHDAGLVHRDIKPANVLLSSRGPVLAPSRISPWSMAMDAALPGVRPGGKAHRYGSARYLLLRELPDLDRGRSQPSNAIPEPNSQTAAGTGTAVTTMLS